MLSADEVFCLSELDKRAKAFERTAYLLTSAVNECISKQSLEGLDEMVAMSFNAAQYQPSYGTGGGGLPPGKYKGVIVDSRQENVEKNGMVTGGYLALDLTPIEGPLVGSKQTDRLNLHNTNPKVMEIAQKQLSAYCHVLNKHQFSDTAELHQIPFYFEIGYQKGEEPSEAKPNGGYTEVKSIADINGNAPGKAGAGPQAQQQQQVAIPTQPAGGVVAQGGGWNGGGAAQPQQQQPQGGSPQVESGIAQPQPAGTWGAQAQPQQQQADPQQQQQAAPAQGGGWGAAAGQAQPQQQQQPAAQPQGGGGWSQGGGAAPAGAWGQR